MAKRPSTDPAGKTDGADADLSASPKEGAPKAAASKEAGKGDKGSDKKTDKDKPKPHDGGWRETVESLAMAIILALLFKGFVAEAFVIPTGSMAPTLQGRHRDICCSQCGYWYQTTASEEVDQQGALTNLQVASGMCPICRYTQTYNPKDRPNEGSFSGDRIIVSKFAYEIAEPKRWDVIVFKFPNGATQNYIKRLVGLPGEHLTVTGGNVYVRSASESAAKGLIARKPPHKLTAMLQLVDDSDHIPPALSKIGWPARWREIPLADNAQPNWKSDDGGKSFACETASTAIAWLRYRHLVPNYEDWESITRENRLPADVSQRRGQLITDLYAYNTSVPLIAGHGMMETGLYDVPSYANHAVRLDDVPQRLLSSRRDQVRYDPDLAGPGIPCDESHLGNHWVDDLAVECLAEIQDAQGTIALDLIRGGVHYTCSIDVSTGQATLRRVDAAGNELPFADEEFRPVTGPQAATSVQGPGYYRLRLTNCDHQVLLFVNGKTVTFDKPTFYESDDIIAPQWSPQDSLDLEPAGVGVSGTRAKISHLRIYRDKYYIAINADNMSTDYLNEYTIANSLPELFASPDLWTSSGLFDPRNRREVNFELDADQFFPMGDNSSGSYDARYWHPSNYVTRDLLIGKALLIYWPHSWNRPPFLPHFQRMGRIR